MISNQKKISKNVVAIPSANPGGLTAPLEAHFGHCAVYTLVLLEQGDIKSVEVIQNMPHQHGGCMAPVHYLADKGVNTLIAGGMGMRPLMGFHQVGIDVFHGGHAQTVGEAIQGLLDDSLAQFGRQQTCGGGSGGCQH